MSGTATDKSNGDDTQKSTTKEHKPPLSWKLIPSEKKFIGDAWARCKEEMIKDSTAKRTEAPDDRPKPGNLDPADLKLFFKPRKP